MMSYYSEMLENQVKISTWPFQTHVQVLKLRLSDHVPIHQKLCTVIKARGGDRQNCHHDIVQGCHRGRQHWRQGLSVLYKDFDDTSNRTKLQMSHQLFMQKYRRTVQCTQSALALVPYGKSPCCPPRCTVCSQAMQSWGVSTGGSHVAI